MLKLYNETIKELRIDNDLKQETIAKELGITKQQYSLYETGQREFKITHLIKLCLFFKISADYILDLPDLPYPKNNRFLY